MPTKAECPFLKMMAAVEEERKHQSLEELLRLKAIGTYCRGCGRFRAAWWKGTFSKETGYREEIVSDRCPRKRKK